MAKNYDQMVSVEKMPRTVYDLVTHSMETLFPECVAFRAVAEDGQTVLAWTYAQMAEDIRRTVTYLKESIPDIKGKKICLLNKNSYEYAVNSFGIMLASVNAILTPAGCAASSLLFPNKEWISAKEIYQYGVPTVLVNTVLIVLWCLVFPL